MTTDPEQEAEPAEPEETETTPEAEAEPEQGLISRVRLFFRFQSIAAWMDDLLAILEICGVMVIGLIALKGLLSRCWESGLDGLLTLLDTKWKGSLMLALLLFYRTGRVLLDRIEGISPVTLRKREPAAVKRFAAHQEDQ